MLVCEPKSIVPFRWARLMVSIGMRASAPSTSSTTTSPSTDAMAPVQLPRPSTGCRRIADEPREVLRGAQRPVDAGRRHFQRVRPGERVELVHEVVDPRLRGGQLVEAHAVGRVYVHANRRGLLRARDLHRDDLDALLLRPGS